MRAAGPVQYPFVGFVGGYAAHEPHKEHCNRYAKAVSLDTIF